MNSQPVIYLDNAATTPVAPEVLAAMIPCLEGACGNPSSHYSVGYEAKERLDAARAAVARVLNAETNEPMEGLFAAGDCSGGFFDNNYPCLLPGIACGRSMTFGIKAVKVAGGIDE